MHTLATRIGQIKQKSKNITIENNKPLEHKSQVIKKAKERIMENGKKQQKPAPKKNKHPKKKT